MICYCNMISLHSLETEIEKYIYIERMFPTTPATNRTYLLYLYIISQLFHFFYH